MNKFKNDHEALPHKKAGKSQSASSPNRHGCPKNDYNAHNYIFVIAYELGFKGNNIPAQVKTSFRMYGMRSMVCEHCGKRKTRKILTNKNYADALFNVLYSKTPDGNTQINKINFKKQDSDSAVFTIGEKIDWNI